MGCNFGKAVNMYRIRQQLALEELAVKARIPPLVLLDIENGAHFPPLRHIERLLAALQICWQQVLIISDDETKVG